MAKKLSELVLSLTPVASMYVTSNYFGENTFVQNYVNDITFTFGLYFGFKFLDSTVSKNPLINAGFSFLIGASTEVFQGFGWLEGSYLENDFYAFLTGSVLALGFDKFFFRKFYNGEKSNYFNESEKRKRRRIYR